MTTTIRLHIPRQFNNLAKKKTLILCDSKSMNYFFHFLLLNGISDGYDTLAETDVNVVRSQSFQMCFIYFDFEFGGVLGRGRMVPLNVKGEVNNVNKAI